MRKEKCPQCGSDMRHSGERNLPHRNNHSVQLWRCNECGYGPVQRG